MPGNIVDRTALRHRRLGKKETSFGFIHRANRARLENVGAVRVLHAHHGSPAPRWADVSLSEVPSVGEQTPPLRPMKLLMKLPMDICRIFDY